jgi:hypothetical protein
MSLEVEPWVYRSARRVARLPVSIVDDETPCIRAIDMNDANVATNTLPSCRDVGDDVHDLIDTGRRMRLIVMVIIDMDADEDVVRCHVVPPFLIDVIIVSV